MSYTRVKTANFGTSRTGLSTVGYTLTGGSRITAGVAEVAAGSGVYKATVTFADGFAGTILWDTGQGGTSRYASEDVNPDGGAETVTAISTSLTSSVGLSISGTVADASPRAYGFTGSSGLSATDNFYAANGLALCFTSGALAGLKATIAGYEGASRRFSFLAPFPSAPADGDAFVIL